MKDNFESPAKFFPGLKKAIFDDFQERLITTAAKQAEKCQSGYGNISQLKPKKEGSKVQGYWSQRLNQYWELVEIGWFA